MRQFLLKYKHAWVLLYFFLYLPWFLILESKVVTDYTLVTIDIDKWIPFNELFVIPYLLWFAYIAATIAFFFFTSKTDFYRCCGFLFIGMTICLIIYTIWPNGQNLRPTSFARDNILVDIAKTLYSADTSTNVCPSIHAFNSIGAHIAISKSERLRSHRWVIRSSFVLMILICLSTMFLKQHSAFDVICSVMLSGFMYVMVYKVDYNKLVVMIKEKKKIHSKLRV